MRLWMTEAQARAIMDEALRAAPHEACGVIGGRGEQALMIVPVRNAAGDPAHFFRLDDAQFVAAMNTFRAAGLSLVGIYHSHPRGEPIPSHTDIRLAAYSDAAYVIIGLRGNTPRLSAWQIDRGRVDSVELHIGMTPPLSVSDAALSPAGQGAVIVSVVVAVLLMIVLSLSLLPPPPVIPAP